MNETNLSNSTVVSESLNNENSIGSEYEKFLRPNPKLELRKRAELKLEELRIKRELYYFDE